MQKLDSKISNQYSSSSFSSLKVNTPSPFLSAKKQVCINTLTQLFLRQKLPLKYAIGLYIRIGFMYMMYGKICASCTIAENEMSAVASIRQPLCRLTGHTGVVIAVDWITGGEQLITASWDRTANIYDAERGEILNVLSGSFLFPFHLSLSDS